MNVDFKLLDFNEILDEIDKRYFALKGNCGRLDVRWGKFSRDMNVELRRRMSSLGKYDSDRDRYMWLHAYWICCSQQLDWHMKKGSIARSKIKKLGKEKRTYLQGILTGKGPEISESKLLKKLMKKG